MALAGKGGAVYVDVSGGVPAKAADIQSWSLDVGADALDVTGFDDAGWRTFVAGLKQWSATIEAKWNYTDANQRDFWDNLGASVDLQLFVDEASNKRFSGTGIVTGVSPSVSVDGTADVTFTVQGSGALTYHTI